MIPVGTGSPRGQTGSAVQVADRRAVSVLAEAVLREAVQKATGRIQQALFGRCAAPQEPQSTAARGTPTLSSGTALLKHGAEGEEKVDRVAEAGNVVGQTAEA